MLSNSMELWDVLDEQGNKTGRTIKRDQPRQQNEYHLLVHVWIKNNQGEFLITKRAPNKAILPNMWETTVGAVMAGEDSLQAALREIREEIGINLTPGHGKRLLRIRNYDFQAFIEVWLFQEEVDITNVIYQPEEVCDAKWADPSQIKFLLHAGEFADTFTYLEDLFILT